MFTTLKLSLYIQYSSLRNSILYSGKLWQEEVWWNDSFQAFGERKFDELIDQSTGY